MLNRARNRVAAASIERRRLRFYSRFIRPGDLVFDLGANVGERTRLFRRLGVRVVAVEPQPELARHLAEEHAGDTLVTVVAKAVGAAAGTAELRRNALDALASMSPRWIESMEASGRLAALGSRWIGSSTVEVATLDDLIAEYGTPAFVKIDVEGSEPEVLAGLSSAVPALSFEYARPAVDVALSSIARLRELGADRFNLVLSDSCEFVWSGWTGPELLARRLVDLEGGDVWGDVYARLERAPAPAPDGERSRPPALREEIDVEISVVNTSNGRLLERCLRSLDEAAAGVRSHTTVVDNASTDGSAEMVEARFPHVELLRNGVRRGFAANHNLVIDRVIASRSARYVLILNEDTELSPGSIAELVRCCDADTAVGAAGPALVEIDGRPQPSAFRFPRLTTEIVSAAILPEALRSLLWRRVVEMRADGAEPAPVDWLLGAALLVRTEALAALGGGFDERFFIYAEDTDIALRLAGSGYASVLCPRAAVTHLGGSSTGSPFARTLGSSRWAYARKHWRRRHRLALLLLLGPVYAWNTAYVAMRVALAPRSAPRKLELWRAHWRSRTAPRLALRASAAREEDRPQ